ASLPPAVLARSCDSLYLPVLEWHRRTIRPMRHNRGREHRMPLYLTRFSYTPATWAKLIEHPEDRRNAATQYIEAVGGKLHGFWYAFGEHDAYTRTRHQITSPWPPTRSRSVPVEPSVPSRLLCCCR